MCPLYVFVSAWRPQRACWCCIVSLLTVLPCLRELAPGRVVEPLCNKKAGVRQGRVDKSLMLFKIRNEFPANHNHCLKQRLANVVADERITGIDDIAISNAVSIFKGDITVG